MNTSTFSFMKLTPDEGKYLTQATLKDGEERIFSTAVHQPVSQSADLWMEVDADYKAQWEAEHPVTDEEQTEP